MSGVKWTPVAGAGAVGLEAPQSSDDHVPSLKARIEIEVEKPTAISMNDLVDAVAYAIKDLLRGLEVYVDDSEVCESASNVYFLSTPSLGITSLMTDFSKAAGR